ncbi:MAG: hypothetical protein KJ601_04565 [Nanoarchaeota archaeon]|nr:hypothetical protein [Nanoarchaeota archaeon]MBU1704323.1 hypothetical protein [Nanoarchaeota archaeon]
MNKKGSLSLSVNAIVILILAITMLGLGLGFIKGMFGKVSQQVQEQIDQEPEPPAASGGMPITLSKETIIAKAGDDIVLKVSAYNPTNDDWGTTTVPDLDCGPNLVLTEQANPKSILVGRSETYNVLFKIPSGTEANRYLCSASIGDTTNTYTKDFTITIKQ